MILDCAKLQQAHIYVGTPITIIAHFNLVTSSCCYLYSYYLLYVFCLHVCMQCIYYHSLTASTEEKYHVQINYRHLCHQKWQGKCKIVCSTVHLVNAIDFVENDPHHTMSKREAWRLTTFIVIFYIYKQSI